MVSNLALRSPFEALSTRGWLVKLAATASGLPPVLRRRYPHLPAHFAAFLGTIETCRNQRDDAWIFGASFFASDDPATFRWNECELMSLASVEGDMAAARQIREYWDHHLPFMMATHSDYDYLAVATTSELPLGAVVHGSGPEFEDSTVVAASFDAFLADLSDAALSRDPRYPLSIFL